MTEVSLDHAALSNSHISRHIEAPFSPEALADERREWIDLGDVDFDRVPMGDFHKPPYTWSGLGESDHEFEYPVLRALHERFENAAKAIVPPEKHTVAEVYFSHWSAPLSRGTNFSFDKPHVDGSVTVNNLSESDRQLRIIGAAANAVPTAVLRGGLGYEDFVNGSNVLSPDVIERLEQIDMPLHKMIIFSPSTVHFAQLAKEDVPIRHFLRWQLHY